MTHLLSLWYLLKDVDYDCYTSLLAIIFLSCKSLLMLSCYLFFLICLVIWETITSQIRNNKRVSTCIYSILNIQDFLLSLIWLIFKNPVFPY